MKLNDAQQSAVTFVSGPCLVLAGAGSGKTRVITNKIAHLVRNCDMPARYIAAVTFTNKAAREMKARIGTLLPKEKAVGLKVSTFHNLGLTIIRTEIKALGFRTGFSILDQEDCRKLIKELLVRRTELDEKLIDTAQNTISNWKNSLLEPGHAIGAANSTGEQGIALLYERYQRALKAYNAVDFDDLIMTPVLMFRQQPEILAKWQNRIRYLLVDEYQDTNLAQYELVKILVNEKQALTVVGDDDQSIYGWRGADIQKILGFEKDFPGAGKVYLGTNYRSTQEIIDAANMVIKNNSSRHEKELRSAYGSGESVSILRVEDEIHEASHICGDIRHQVGLKQAHYRDFAILCRTAQQPRAFETELRSANIPYKLVGGQSFFDRKEVRDILSYLRVIDNPADETSFLRIVNTPPRGIGKGTIDKILAKATEEGKGAYAVFKESHAANELAAAASKGFGKLSDALRTAYISVQANEDLVATLRKLISDIDYHEEVARCYPDPDTAQVRWAGVDEILNFAEKNNV